VTDLEANKQTVLTFFDVIFNQRRIEEGVERCVGPTYTQHNPEIADGRDGLIAFVNGVLAEFPQFSLQCARLTAEDDRVVVHVLAKRTPEDRGIISLDMFRLEEGRIVEHWDVIQEVPASSANGNGMW
jgi:predicted SnoaL-like aldol condensation-catalyzing enzyme